MADWLGIGTAVGELAGAGVDFLNNERNIKFQKETNEQNLRENSRNRLFNAAEAEKQRQFTEQFYQNYESPMAQVEQMQKAGLNPALMMSNGASFNASQSSGAASFGSGIAAQSPQSSTDLFSSTARGIGSLAQASLDKKNAEYVSNQNDFYVNTMGMREEKVRAELNTERTRAKLNESNISLNEANESLVTAKKTLAELDYQQQVEIWKYTLEAARLDNQLKQVKIDEGTEAIENLKKQRSVYEAQIKDYLASASLSTERAKYVSKEFDVDKYLADMQRYIVIASLLNAGKRNTYGSFGMLGAKGSAGGQSYDDAVLRACKELGYDVTTYEDVKKILHDTDDILDAYGSTD